MKTLTRIERVKNTWGLINVTLEVVDFIGGGIIRRAVRRRLNDVNYKRPATVRVKSERPPIR